MTNQEMVDTLVHAAVRFGRSTGPVIDVTAEMHREAASKAKQAVLSRLESLESQRAALLADARRYRRLRLLGCAPCGTTQLDEGTVIRFQGLDAHVDDDLRAHPSRGEAEGATT